MKSIKDIVDTLTDEEREIHKDLISECVEREKGIDELKETAKRFEESLGRFRAKLAELNELLQKAQELKSDKLLLETLPDENFYKA